MFTRQNIGACALASLRDDREDFGVVFVGKPLGEGEWPTEDRALLALTAQMLLHSARHDAQMRSLLASQAALRQANQQLEVLSRHDALTGLPNRRYFDELKAQEFQRALRSGKPLTLMVCDIDYFKAYNDHYGHAAGDECLCRVARAMRAAITRSGDALARIGGEEFAILLPATTAQAGHQVAERVRRAVQEQAIAHALSQTCPHVTVSIGVAQLEPDAPGFEALFEAADKALYDAKRLGRNGVAVAPWGGAAAQNALALGHHREGDSP